MRQPEADLAGSLDLGLRGAASTLEIQQCDLGQALKGAKKKPHIAGFHGFLRKPSFRAFAWISLTERCI
jgi:hypothetical protein